MASFPRIVLAVIAIAVVAVIAGVLFKEGSREYYSASLADRALLPQHAALRPTGTTGHLLGLTGTLLMTPILAYVIRKRSRRLANAGSMKSWLEVHMVCGVLGPLLITFHTAFKFGGAISVAYWSMLLVVLSGFTGRFLYTRIPRTIRGAELDRQAAEGRAVELKAALAETTIPFSDLLRIEEFEREVIPSPGEKLGFGGLVLGEVRVRRGLARLQDDLHASRGRHAPLDEACYIAAERAFLLRRIAYLQVSKELFNLWHVLHLPLVWLLLLVVSAHVSLAILLGYTYFG